MIHLLSVLVTFLLDHLRNHFSLRSAFRFTDSLKLFFQSCRQKNPDFFMCSPFSGYRCLLPFCDRQGISLTVWSLFLRWGRFRVYSSWHLTLPIIKMDHQTSILQPAEISEDFCTTAYGRWRARLQARREVRGCGFNSPGSGRVRPPSVTASAPDRSAQAPVRPGQPARSQSWRSRRSACS